MSSSVSPSASAATCASPVRVPVPISCVPVTTSAAPSEFSSIHAYPGGLPPPAPQSCAANPMPFRIRPDSGLSGRPFQPAAFTTFL